MPDAEKEAPLSKPPSEPEAEHPSELPPEVSATIHQLMKCRETEWEKLFCQAEKGPHDFSPNQDETLRRFFRPLIKEFLGLMDIQVPPGSLLVRRFVEYLIITASVQNRDVASFQDEYTRPGRHAGLRAVFKNLRDDLSCSDTLRLEFKECLASDRQLTPVKVGIKDLCQPKLSEPEACANLLARALAVCAGDSTEVCDELKRLLEGQTATPRKYWILVAKALGVKFASRKATPELTGFFDWSWVNFRQWYYRRRQDDRPFEDMVRPLMSQTR